MGGTGADTYIINIATDVINEASTILTELDTVQSTVSYTLGLNLENLTLIGSSIVNGTGNGLNNKLTGNSANNILSGGLGNDTLTGGSGVDSFVFNTKASSTNLDKLIDFVKGSDQIHIENSIYTSIGSAGKFVSGDARFYSASGAVKGHDLSDRLILDSTSNTLYYDADGSGSIAAIKIAVLNTIISATDIFVI